MPRFLCCIIMYHYIEINLSFVVVDCLSTREVVQHLTSSNTLCATSQVGYGFLKVSKSLSPLFGLPPVTASTSWRVIVDIVCSIIQPRGRDAVNFPAIDLPCSVSSYHHVRPCIKHARHVIYNPGSTHMMARVLAVLVQWEAIRMSVVRIRCRNHAHVFLQVENKAECRIPIKIVTMQLLAPKKSQALIQLHGRRICDLGL